MSKHKPVDTRPKDPAKVIRRTTLLVILTGLAIISIFFTFKGLSSPRGMEQAQIGRELARGNGYSTKVIRPITLWQMEKANQEIPSLEKIPETYHAPLNPYVYAAVLKAADANDSERWRMPQKSNVYQLDRIIAATCVIFFLIAMGVNYLLISRIFDTTIASVTVLLMLFCELMWKFSQSGMPQMLMLMLFSCGMFFIWRGMENLEENRSPLGPVLISGLCMCLLVLTHWIAIWIYIGFVIFAAIYFKPRGIIAAILIGMLLIIVLPVAYFLYAIPTGSLLGTAYYAIHNGLGSSEDSILRSLAPEGSDLGLKSLLLNILATMLRQISDLYENLGAILAAPVFFIALLHPFKRESLASFRWLILLMWAFAGIGMSIYGLKLGAMDPNQVHILFAPLMAAYGLAMVSILWARLNVLQSVDSMRYMHYIAIVAISAGPMLISTPRSLMTGLQAEGYGGLPQWPPYFPKSYNRTLADNTTSKDVIITDVPWAVAWYADRMAVWLPRNLQQIKRIEAIATDQETPVSGILISPYSFNDDKILSTGSPKGTYGDLYPLVYNVWARFGGAGSFMNSDRQFKPLAQRYKHRYPLFSFGYITYYSNRPVVPSTD